ncbi:hypothetical protein KH5H1_09720 [Corallococcus caeni]|uniref:hypothetical protein n=1 Tax=Corallococcus caeni TaxID=3082388 RepID=UPI002957D0FC|nr:hypothetical protein KH5H1_09720 [Corallococcus sp. KH5-1]
MVEDAIWRAATYTQADLEALTEPLPQGLRVTLSRLLQRSSADRYQTARELAADLRRWLGEGKVYGPDEAEAELHSLMRRAGEALNELGIRTPRSFAASQDEFSTN